MTRSIEQNSNGVRHVVIVGGGFAGLNWGAVRRSLAQCLAAQEDNHSEDSELLYGCQNTIVTRVGLVAQHTKAF